MKNIIIKPILTEKLNMFAENALLNQFTFQVAKNANKIEIKKAVEEQFGVTVTAVNTFIRPGKSKARIVKGRHTKGRTSSIKKAIVTVAEGEYIDGFLGDVDMDNVEIADENLEAEA